jgi:hypothetical protein
MEFKLGIAVGLVALTLGSGACTAGKDSSSASEQNETALGIAPASSTIDCTAKNSTGSPVRVDQGSMDYPVVSTDLEFEIPNITLEIDPNIPVGSSGVRGYRITLWGNETDPTGKQSRLSSFLFAGPIGDFEISAAKGNLDVTCSVTGAATPKQ